MSQYGDFKTPKQNKNPQNLPTLAHSFPKNPPQRNTMACIQQAPQYINVISNDNPIDINSVNDFTILLI